jgi:hypothetical protein
MPSFACCAAPTSASSWSGSGSLEPSKRPIVGLIEAARSGELVSINRGGNGNV